MVCCCIFPISILFRLFFYSSFLEKKDSRRFIIGTLLFYGEKRIEVDHPQEEGLWVGLVFHPTYLPQTTP